MVSRRDFLKQTLGGSTLLALGSSAPGFLASTALAAEPDEETILVVVELTGGNDGLNTVVPHGDDLYHKARPTLRIEADEVIPLNDHIGLNPALRPLQTLLDEGQLAVLQGIGYPNPNRSHFESMDIWHSADPKGTMSSGWLARSVPSIAVEEGQIPAFHVAKDPLPLALKGAATAVPALHPDKPFDLHLFGSPAVGEEANFGEAGTLQTTDSDSDKYKSRMKLISELSQPRSQKDKSLLQFVQRTSLQTYATIEQLRDIVNRDFEKPEPEFDFRGGEVRYIQEGLGYELALVSRMIAAGFGTRVYYVSIDGFDTHGSQRQSHDGLLEQLAGAVATFFAFLESSGDAKRVLLVTFSEFGRRVAENGSQGTDHGAASCMFAVGPSVRGGLFGEHPSLENSSLFNGDLKYHTDFRRVYATLLDRWLRCSSQQVLGAPFEHLDFLA